MTSAPTVVIAVSAAVLVSVSITALALLLLLRRRQRRNAIQGSQNTAHPPHKKVSSDASRLLPLLTPSELSHESFSPDVVQVHQTTLHHTYLAAAPTAVQPEPSLPNANAPSTPSLRLLPPLPQPNPSELDFHLSRHLPSLIIPSTPFSDTPLASSIRLTPGPITPILSSQSQSPENDSSPSAYSDSPSPASPLSQGYDQALTRLDTIRISHMLQARAKAYRRVPSRSSARSSSVLGRQNSLMSVLSTMDVAEEDAVDDDPQLGPEPVAGPAVLNQKRSRSRLRIKGRLLPPTPGSIVRPPEQHEPPPPPPLRNVQPLPPHPVPASSSTVYGDQSRPRTAPEHDHAGTTTLPVTHADRPYTSTGHPGTSTHTPRSTRPPLPPLPTTAQPVGGGGSSRGWRALPPIVHPRPTAPA